MSEKPTSDTTVVSSSEPSTPTSTVSLSLEKTSFQLPNDIEPVQKTFPEWKPQKQEYLIMFTLSIISLMVALDATILVPVLPTIATDLHGSATDSFWVGTSYLLACAVFQPFIAALSDIFGRRELLLPSLLLFAIGSIICGVAHNFAVLLVGRCVQGIGGGGIIAGAQIIFADIIPLRQRPKWFSLVLIAWAIGTILGPLLGGVFAEKASWRWAFWINLPFCGFGLVSVLLFVKLETVKTSLKEKVLRVDWLGGFIFISSLTAFLIGLAWAGAQFAWSDYRTLVPLILGAAGVVLSLIWEKYGAREPFLRKSLFYEVSAIAAYICALMQGLVLFCSLYYLPFYFLAVKSKSPISAGLAIFPFMCAFLPGSAIVSQLITRLGRFRWAIWAGWLIATAGAGLLVLIDCDTRTPVWAGIQVVFGLGSGMVLSSINFGIQAIVKTEDCGRAASMYAFMRTLGMTIGVAIGGTVFQNLTAQKLVELSLPVEISRDAEAFIAILESMAATDPTRIGILQAYVHGFKGVFAMLAGVSGLGLLASLLIKHHDMNKILKSSYRISRQFD